MKTIPFFKSDGIYVAASFSSANTFFFKNEKECEILHSKIRIHLQNMIDIIKLRCFPGGWILLFKSKSASQIKNAYLRMNKDKEKLRHEDVEHILSEQFRLANSMTVRSCNSICDRSGSRVHSTLIKMIFECEEEYGKLLDKLSKISVFTNQSLIEYYPELGKVASECRVDISNVIKKGNKSSGLYSIL